MDPTFMNHFDFTLYERIKIKLYKVIGVLLNALTLTFFTKELFYYFILVDKRIYLHKITTFPWEDMKVQTTQIMMDGHVIKLSDHCKVSLYDPNLKCLMTYYGLSFLERTNHSKCCRHLHSSRRIHLDYFKI